MKVAIQQQQKQQVIHTALHFCITVTGVVALILRSIAVKYWKELHCSEVKKRLKNTTTETTHCYQTTHTHTHTSLPPSPPLPPPHQASRESHREVPSSGSQSPKLGRASPGASVSPNPAGGVVLLSQRSLDSSSTPSHKGSTGEQR